MGSAAHVLSVMLVGGFLAALLSRPERRHDWRVTSYVGVQQEIASCIILIVVIVLLLSGGCTVAVAGIEPSAVAVAGIRDQAFLRMRLCNME
ncbi:hypothetical protein N183_37015 [Sinorhizobium sp. Sb3]|nr:hypothetical protein N183_37015 [Sinorhizobium sp. Sb3]